MKKNIVIIALCILITATFLSLDRKDLTAWVLSHLTGYRISFQEISLSDGVIKDITIKGDDFDVSINQLIVNKPIQSLFRYNIEILNIDEPKLHIIKTSAGQSNLSFLKKIPKIEQLNITKGSFVIASKESNYKINIDDVIMNIKDYSPKKGGSMTFTAKIGGYIRANMDISGDVKGVASIIASEDDLILQGNIVVDIPTIKSKELNVRAVHLKTNFGYRASDIKIQNGQSTVDEIAIETNKKTFLVKELKAIIDFNSKDMSLNISDLNSRLANIGRINGRASVNLKDDIVFSTNFIFQEIDIHKGIDLLESISNVSLKELNMSGKGKIIADLTGTYTESGLYIKDGSAEISLNDGAFSSGDGLKMGQGISGNIIIHFDGKDDIKKNRLIQGKITSELKKGEFLWDRFYYNHKDRPIIINAIFDKPVDEQGFNAVINADLLNTGSYEFNIKSKSTTEIKGVLKNLYLNSIYDIFLKDSAPNMLPNLEGLEINGIANINLSLEIDDSYSYISSMLNLKEVNISIPKLKLDAKKINGNLPIYISSVHKEMSSHGYFNIDSLNLGFIKTEGIKIPFSSEVNKIKTKSPVLIRVMKGEATVEDVIFEFDLKSKPKTKFSLTLKDLNLSEMRHSLGLANLEGLINGTLDVMSLQQNRFKSIGRLDIDIFGGTVKVYDIYGDMSFKNLGTDIEFDDIDLERLTQTVKIGKMTGVIYGTIKDLLIQYGQAGRFVLDINSRKKEGIRQTVSTDAIENISILGTGSEGFSRLLSTGINQFFKEFPYSAIGIRCRLDNDVFTIRGKIQEGGKEYLIKRTFLRGIDVINQNPDNTISFKDMQRRLSAIFQNVTAKGND